MAVSIFSQPFVRRTHRVIRRDRPRLWCRFLRRDTSGYTGEALLEADAVLVDEADEPDVLAIGTLSPGPLHLTGSRRLLGSENGVEVLGPALEDEAARAHDGFWT